MNNLRIVRGEGAYAASHEFVVTFPDGSTTTAWSPPWNDYPNPQHEARRAYLYAVKVWREEHGEEGL